MKNNRIKNLIEEATIFIGQTIIVKYRDSNGKIHQEPHTFTEISRAITIDKISIVQGKLVSKVSDNIEKVRLQDIVKHFNKKNHQ